ncbi:MAG: tagatose 1,6-diphosphate aldolase [Gemmataceae bacterium]|nr:tagatose 1,6-diphosphate aldolase [Gemmataceae bacterium]
MSANKTNVSRLLGLGFTPGKLRGLQRISNPNGTLTMVATDQNSSMISMIKDSLKKKNENREPTYEEIVEAKIHLAGRLGPHCSGLLVDGYYGVWNTIASMSMPRNTGLLVRVEKSGGEKNKHGAPLGAFEPGFSVAKIKSLGADAVKLLAQFEPTEGESAEHNFQFIQKVYAECQKHDILFLLETIAFPFGGEKKDSASFLDRKVHTVIETARWVSRYCDIYKAEFPGWLNKHSEQQLRDNCKELDKVCERPWVLLSAGVDFGDYRKQVDMALDCGASGVLGGRAFWKEYFLQDGFEARDKFAAGECVERVKTIDAMVQKKGKPWFARYGLTPECLSGMRASEGWLFRYGSAGASGSAGKLQEGDVY